MPELFLEMADQTIVVQQDGLLQRGQNSIGVRQFQCKFVQLLNRQSQFGQVDGGDPELGPDDVPDLLLMLIEHIIDDIQHLLLNGIEFPDG